jgi:hypothetical protein
MSGSIYSSHMPWKVVEVLAEVFTAIGTVLVAVVAIWGDFLRYKLAGPQLELSLNDPRGDLTPRTNQTHAYFFHLKIRNRRLWSPAKDVRVLLERIARRRPDGSFFVEPLVYALPMTWTPSEMGEVQRTVAETEMCDLGSLDENSDRFILSAFIRPSNFKGWVLRNDAIHIRIVASGQNATSSKPLSLEIAWDGVWPADDEEIQKHLVIKEIAAL